ncbi:hypothetical protein [Desulfobulbus alkaliphilus]|uniref:hypothetical protein n=1 Tax=Desulfobulbus alkaliphilus TaxID=869814 RepID=UPI0019624219|nr:hypothetical protein [Desulfobulbus alkaliphilus]MBM9538748.1 hypothetical protein [Desulfobulbus alkaliphilus]
MQPQAKSCLYEEYICQRTKESEEESHISMDTIWISERCPAAMDAWYKHKPEFVTDKLLIIEYILLSSGYNFSGILHDTLHQPSFGASVIYPQIILDNSD